MGNQNSKGADLPQSDNSTEQQLKRLQIILDNAPSPVGIVEAPEGKTIYMNKRAAQLYGLDMSDSDLNVRLAKLQPKKADGTPYGIEESPTYRTLKKGEEIDREEVITQKVDGTQLNMLVSTKPLYDSNGKITAAIAIFEDITESKKAEVTLQKNILKLELIASVTSQLLSSANPQSLVHEICESTMAFLDCDVFFNFMVDKQEGKLHLNAYAGVPANTAKSLEWLNIGEAVCGCAAQQGKQIVCENILETDDPKAALVRSFGIKAYAANPIFADGKVIGTLSFGTKKKPTFTEDELSLMKTMTEQVSVAMQRKNDEEKLKRSEEKARQRAEELQKLMDIIPAAIWVSNDPECKTIFGNETANSFYEAIDGENVSAGPASGNDQDTTRRFFRNGKELLPKELPMQEAAAKNREIKNTELEVLTPSGKKMTILGSAKPLIDNKGKVRGCLGTFIDITERKNAEEERRQRTEQLELTQKKLEEKAAEVEEYACRMEELVRERTEKLERTANYARNLIEASLDPLVTISAEGKITDVNEATEKATGCSREELIGSDFSSYFTEPQKAEAGYKKVFIEGSVRDYPLAIRRKSGQITYVLYNASTYSDEKGKIQGVFAAARDITEQRMAEEQAKEAAKKLKDSQRLAAIGATAGMVGHDIRNPLQAIVSDVFLAKTELDSIQDCEAKKSVIESLQEIEENTEYINKIVQDLQDYARPLNPKQEESDIVSIVNKILEKSAVPENIVVNIRVDSNARYVSTDSYYLSRILYNLIINAIQAMPNGGSLTVGVDKEVGDVVITVADTGIGISQEVQSKMFTVMFTTKSKGQGFGLPVVKRMTESLGGTVSFKSQEGKGTTFIVRLPAEA